MSDQYLTLTEAAKVAPGRPTRNQLWRWASQGVRCRDGTSLYLYAIQPGREILTTPQAVVEFGAERLRRNRAAKEHERENDRTHRRRGQKRRRLDANRKAFASAKT